MLFSNFSLLLTILKPNNIAILSILFPEDTSVSLKNKQESQIATENRIVVSTD